MPANPFDQFDSPQAGAGANPFDQFDKETPDKGDAPKDTSHHFGADILRGAARGAGGVADMLMTLAAPNVVDRNSSGALTGYHNTAPAITPHIENGLDRAGVANGTTGADQLVQAAASGVTGGALTGGVGGIIPGALSSVAQTGAALAGASPMTQAAVGLGAGLLPGARKGLGDASRNLFAHLDAKGMTPEEAMQVARVNADVARLQSQAPRPVSTHQAAGALKKDLASKLGTYNRSGSDAGLISDGDRNSLATAVSQANAHTNAISSDPASAFGAVQAAQIPGRDHVVQALQDLDAVSPQQFKVNSSGPVARAMASLRVPVKAAGVAATALHHPTAAVGEILGLMNGHTNSVANRALGAVGAAGDRILGTQTTPAAARAAAASLVLKRAGITPGKSSLDTLTALNRGLSGEDPQALFEATNGAYGSPSGPSSPGVGGISQPTAPVGSTQPPQRPTGNPQPQPATQPPEAGPGTFQPLLRGGQALSQKMLLADPAGHGPATQAELFDAARRSGLPQDDIDGFIRGDNTDRYTANRVAGMVVHGRGGSHPGDYDAEAHNAVKSAFAQAKGAVNDIAGVPNGETAGGPPIDNAYRWNSAKDNALHLSGSLQDAAHRMSKPHAAVTIARIAAEPNARAKAELAQAYIDQDPSAAFLFPPELLKGK